MAAELFDTTDYKEPEGAVDFETFVTSSKYLGLDGIYPFWLAEMSDFNSMISSLLLTGSLGGGKTSIANIALAYRIYLLFLQGDPCATLGLMSGSPIYCLYFSVSMTSAKRSGFQQLKSLFDNSKWFKENYPRDKTIESSIRFKNNFSVEFASGGAHHIGLNVWGFILDEANFRSGGVGSGAQSEFSEVTELAQQLEDRQFSRFTRGGVLQTFACYVSSASYASAFIEEKMIDLLRHPERAKVIRAVLYKIQPQNYSKEMFEVFCGYQQISPTIVQNREHRRALVKQTKLDKVSARDLFEKVPVTLQEQFEKNIYLAIQNHCGRSTSMRGTFITNYEIVKRSYDYERPTPLRAGLDSVVLSSEDDSQMWDIVDFEAIENPGAPHSAYVDLSSSGDEGSFTLVRHDGIVGGVKHHTQVFSIRIIPPQFPAQTQISKVKAFVLRLAQYVNLVAFGSDQFQSLMLRQEVTEELGIPNIRISLDSSDLPFLMWLGALVDKRFRMLYYARMDKEIKEAIHDVKKHKVVKPDGGSDDQFQSLVGAFFLSETVGASEGNIADILGMRVNLVGQSTMLAMLDKLGYSSAGLWWTRTKVQEQAAPPPPVRRILRPSTPTFTPELTTTSPTPTKSVRELLSSRAASPKPKDVAPETIVDRMRRKSWLCKDEDILSSE